MNDNGENNHKDTLQNLALIGQIGFSVITPILLGAFIGQFLDKKLSKRGIFSIIFIIFGAITGFIYLLKLSTKKLGKK
ncbi:MAG: AtpZ/AtpI family protein [Tissierellaceae bacterium]